MWKILKHIKKGTYDYAYVPDHPKATKNGYVLYHRVVMENSIGRLLQENEQVHHIDGNTHNNSLSNLQLMTAYEHMRYHAEHKKRTYAEIKCPICGNTYIKRKRDCIDKKQYCCSKHCGRLFQLLSVQDKTERINHCVLRIFKM